jgi:hypothetical protein
MDTTEEDMGFGSRHTSSLWCVACGVWLNGTGGGSRFSQLFSLISIALDTIESIYND